MTNKILCNKFAYYFFQRKNIFRTIALLFKKNTNGLRNIYVLLQDQLNVCRV